MTPRSMSLRTSASPWPKARWWPSSAPPAAAKSTLLRCADPAGRRWTAGDLLRSGDLVPPTDNGEQEVTVHADKPAV